eukprot:579513-Alexandrium_andersonii.AAC.1
MRTLRTTRTIRTRRTVRTSQRARRALRGTSALLPTGSGAWGRLRAEQLWPPIGGPPCGAR